MGRILNSQSTFSLGVNEAGITLSDVTTDNVSISMHGFMPKLPNNAGYVFQGNGVWTALDTDGTLAANSDTKIPSQKAVKTYADTKIATTDTISQRINPRTNTVASSATPAINTDTTDIFTITALAAAITSMTSSLTGTPVNGQKLIIRIKDNGSAWGITWGASFASRGATLPTTTVLGKYLYVGLIYNSTATVWDCVAVSQEI